MERFLRGKEREAVRSNLPPSLPPYGFRFNPKEQVVSGKGWGLRKVIRDAAGLPASPAWGSRRLGTGEGCMCSFGLSDDRVWETELVGGREPWGQTGPPHAGVRPLKVPATAHCGAAGTGTGGGRDHLAARSDGDWTHLRACLCQASLVSLSLSRVPLPGHQSPDPSLS